MGCFNMMGFASNLPIQYDDKIVLFICYNFNNLKNSNSSVYHTDLMTPLFLPVTGKYNDSGGIEDYDTKITDVIENITGVNFKDFLNCISNSCGNYSLYELTELEKTQNTYILKDIDIYKRALNNIIKNIINDDNSVFNNDNMQNFSVSYIIERYDVYKKMSSMYYDDYINNSEFNDLLDIRERFKLKGFILNEYKTSMYFLDIMDKYYSYKYDGKSDIYEKEILNEFGKDKKISNKVNNILFKLQIHGNNDLCIGYSNIRLDELSIKNEIKDFICFNFALSSLCLTYNVSSIANQDISYEADKFNELNSFYSKIISKIKK